MNKLSKNLNENNKNKLKSFLKIHFNSICALLLLTTIVSLITYYRIIVQIEIGPVSDSVVFLSNALVFAGNGIGYSNLLFPPFFSFIISLFFRLGYVSSSTIFAVDGGLFVFGVIGLFLFLKTRFNDLESFLGGLLYATFTPVLLVLGIGFSDLASVSFTIWALYFMVLAVKKDSKFFYLAFPFAMFAFLTRYNSGLLIFPIFLYILINRDKINFKDIFLGITASILIIIPVLIFFYEKFGNIIYPFTNFVSTSAGVSGTIESNIAYHPSIFFFIQGFPGFIGVQGIIIMLIIGIGVLSYLLLKFIPKIRDKGYLFDGLSLKNRSTRIKLIAFLILGIIFLASFGKIFYMESELLFFAMAYLFYDLTKNRNIKNMDVHIMVFAWFMVFFIFQSVFVIKNGRYFVMMAPPVAYFMILGLSEIFNKVKFKIINRNVAFSILAIILIAIILITTATQISNILPSNNDIKIQDEQVKLASQWFVNYDPNYKNENIYSTLWPNFSWYLKTDVKMVPIFEAYQTSPDGNRIYILNQASNNAFNQYLLTNNADYFFCDIPGLNLTSYTPIKDFGNMTIYKKKT